MSPQQRQLAISTLTDEECELLAYDWLFWARDKQIAPDTNWTFWLILAGRGFGKTRTGAEWIRGQAKHKAIVNLIGATSDDARDIMVDGESGILAVCPPDERPTYKKYERKLIWPNGSLSLIFTADQPDRLRGKQHMALWADELCSWRYAQDAWDQAMFGLRLGPNPQALITTTPRPIKQLVDLMKDPATTITYGTTYENRPNLAPAFYKRIIKKYEGTRLGRQELTAELLSDVPGALWGRAKLEELRVKSVPDLIRVVVAIDPPASSDDENAEAGIIIAGIGPCRCKGHQEIHGFVLEDYSRHGEPAAWAKAGTDAYNKFRADLIVGEVNNGGEMVGFTVLTVDPTVNYKPIRASRGKYTRAEPISALYQKGQVHHLGLFPELEDQMCTWLPGEKSPDRMDALVWALTELFYEETEDDSQEGLEIYDQRVEISAI